MPMVSQSHAALHAQEVVHPASEQLGREQDSGSVGLGSRCLFYQGLWDSGLSHSLPVGPKFN